MVGRKSFPRRPVPGKAVSDPSVTKLRVNIFDLDMLAHVNNGIYMQMADLARWDYFSELGLTAKLRQKHWYPVVAATTVKYKRSMNLGEKIIIKTRIIGWDERCVYLEQVFWFGDTLCATVWIAARFLETGGKRIAAPDILALLPDGAGGQVGVHLDQPELPEAVASWAKFMDVAPRSTKK